MQEKIQIIENVLSSLRPAIKADGGDIEFVKYENKIVYVKLHGACVHCPISLYTLKLGVEESLKAQLPELKEVVAVNVANE